MIVDLSGFEDVHEVKLKISNLTGKVVFRQILYGTSRSEIILPSNLEDSIYLISAEADKIKLTNKLVKY